MRVLWPLLLLITLPSWAIDIPGTDLPDVAITQGANAPDNTGVREVKYEDLCPHANTKTVRNVAAVQKAKAFAAYGLVPMSSLECTGPGPKNGLKACYEIDHDCSLELGCTNVQENLWPQRYDGTVWNAHVKDKLENELHKRICAHQISIPDAQQCISVDWIECYKRTIGDLQ